MYSQSDSLYIYSTLFDFSECLNDRFVDPFAMNRRCQHR